MAEKIFSLEACEGRARAGRLKTAHGEIPTPIFMPVGTAGTVKALAPDDLLALGAPMILGNAYHLYLRPGDDLIARHGGLHGFASWPGAILTDSGGFQAFSLSGLRKLTPEGVEFRSHLDGSKHFFTPAKVIGIQKNLNSDIMMVLDECAPYGAEREYTEKSVELTSAWAEEARDCWPGNGGKNLLFGIVQGGFYKDLREKSARRIAELDFDGLAVGGLSVGETKRELHEFVDFTFGMLPEEKPRYLMGVGTPLDIALGIARGVDMFDCVLPTRNARNGTLYTSRGKINIKGKAYADSGEALDPACGCYACRNFSRAYLRHLYMSRELLAYRLNTLHNLTYFLNLVREARKAILEKRYDAFMEGIAAIYPDEAERSGCFGKIWA